jgi:hypothetical protein
MKFRNRLDRRIPQWLLLYAVLLWLGLEIRLSGAQRSSGPFYVPPSDWLLVMK